MLAMCCVVVVCYSSGGDADILSMAMLEERVLAISGDSNFRRAASPLQKALCFFL